MERPIKNIIVVCVDTYRKDFLRIYKSKNPTLNGLELESDLSDFIKRHGNAFVYDKYFPVSYPTVQYRRDFFEGRPYWKYGYFEPIPDDSITLASELSDHGVATQCITDIPHYLRFNLFHGFQGIELIHGHPAWSETKGNIMGTYCFPKKVPLKYDETLYRYVATPTKFKYRSLLKRGKPFYEEIFESAEKWIKGYKKGESSPFLLWVDVWEPHEPWSYIINGLDIGLDDPAYVDADFYNQVQHSEIRELYTELHRNVSHRLALFAKRLYEQGDLTDTLFFIISDHGYSLGEHGKFGKLPSRDTLLRKLPDEKPWGLFEEEIGVPFIAFFPESVNTSEIKLKGIITPFELRDTILYFLEPNNTNRQNIFSESFVGLETSIVIPAGSPAGDFKERKYTLDYQKFGFTVVEDYGQKRTVFFGEQTDYMFKYDLTSDAFQLSPEILPKFSQDEIDLLLSKY